jgi:hypothetical protein
MYQRNVAQRSTTHKIEGKEFVWLITTPTTQE